MGFRAEPQAVYCWLLTTDIRVRYQFRRFGIYGRKCGTGTLLYSPTSCKFTNVRNIIL